MTQDEMERTIEFIVKQQAQFTTDMQQVRDVLQKHSEAFVGVLGILGRLTEAQLRTDSRMEVLESKMAELAEVQKETGERLNAFIVFVEKYISSRNGGTQGSKPH